MEASNVLDKSTHEVDFTFERTVVLPTPGLTAAANLMLVLGVLYLLNGMFMLRFPLLQEGYLFGLTYFLGGSAAIVGAIGIRWGMGWGLQIGWVVGPNMVGLSLLALIYSNLYSRGYAWLQGLGPGFIVIPFSIDYIIFCCWLLCMVLLNRGLLVPDEWWPEPHGGAIPEPPASPPPERVGEEFVEFMIAPHKKIVCPSCDTVFQVQSGSKDAVCPNCGISGAVGPERS